MGMDVFGKEPKNERGRYFRRSVWGWHPLWSYVETQHPDIAKFVEYGHTNDGDGLDADLSVELSVRLRDDIDTGTAGVLVAARDAAIAALPTLECVICSGTGQRPDGYYGVEWKQDGCNGCSGTGRQADYETYYRLEVEDIAEFADFLADCGGFSIC